MAWKDDDLKLLKLVIEAKTNSMSEGQTTYFNLVIVRLNGSYYALLLRFLNRKGEHFGFAVKFNYFGLIIPITVFISKSLS